MTKKLALLILLNSMVAPAGAEIFTVGPPAPRRPAPRRLAPPSAHFLARLLAAAG